MKKEQFKYLPNDEVNIGNGVKVLLIDKEPVRVKNPYSGDSCVLEPVAVAIHDFIKGCEMTGNYDKMSYALDVFSQNWASEYMVLLD